MVFNSLTFLVFFAVVWAAHQLPLSWTVKKSTCCWQAMCSMRPGIRPSSCFCSFLHASITGLPDKMGRLESNAARRSWLFLSLALNLGLLGFFKYGNFLRDNFAAFVGAFGGHYQPSPIDIILPLGISFYTFETISYLIDVYRRRIEPWDSFSITPYS
jgi:alginate O-acetyltransferase complex protein AlgI